MQQDLMILNYNEHTHTQKKNPQRATFALTQTGDTCVQSANSEMKALLRDVTDAIGLNLKTVHELSTDRRAKILHAQNVNQK